MAHFTKKRGLANPEVSTASLPDIIFMLLFFFMVTTVLREVTLKVKLDLTKATNIEKIEEKRLVSYIYMGPERLPQNQFGEDKIQIDDAIVEDIGSIRNLMYDKLLVEPRMIVSLRVDEDSEFSLLSDVTKELQQAGTFKINYSAKREE